MSSQKKSSVVVVGDGWAALGAVAVLTKAGERVRWLAGSGSRLVSPLPTMEVGGELHAAAALRKIASDLGIELGDLQTGSYLREFRNKAFREPVWMKAPTPETRQETRDESLWEPERRLVPLFEGRYALTLAEIEVQLREKLLGGEFKNLKREEGVPLAAIHTENGAITKVSLGSGEELACERLIYADRWNALSGIEGMPKGLTFTRKREPTGVLQATFTHEAPMGMGLMEGFFGPLHREAGESFERHMWGYFTSEGTRSYWTLCMAPDEVEDNHAIAKKLRRMKNALDKMFAGSTWLPENKPEFMNNVQGEQVRFEEFILFTEGEPVREPISLDRLNGVQFLTDGYGPSMALNQLGSLFQFDYTSAPGANPEAENVDLNPSVTS